MNAIWILVLCAVGVDLESVPIAFPTQQTCEREAARASKQLSTPHHPVTAICLKRDGDR